VGLGKILSGRSGCHFWVRKRPMGFRFVLDLFGIAKTIGVAVRYRVCFFPACSSRSNTIRSKAWGRDSQREYGPGR
jgi:hypothetical protein